MLTYRQLSAGMVNFLTYRGHCLFYLLIWSWVCLIAPLSHEIVTNRVGLRFGAKQVR